MSGIKPSQVKAGANPFGAPKELVKPNRGLNDIARIRQSHSKEDLIKYNEILTKEGWKINPKGEYFETNDSEVGKGAPYYVSSSKNLHNITNSERKHTSTWDESNALSRSNIIDVNAAARRNSRRNRRRSSRKHRRSYRKRN
jgi:hypothetical protein